MRSHGTPSTHELGGAALRAASARLRISSVAFAETKTTTLVRHLVRLLFTVEANVGVPSHLAASINTTSLETHWNILAARVCLTHIY